MKDIITRINEFFPIMSKALSYGKTPKQPVQSKTNIKIDKLFKEIIWHKEKDRKKALELVIKDNMLDKKTAKQLTKYTKNLLNL